MTTGESGELHDSADGSAAPDFDGEPAAGAPIETWWQRSAPLAAGASLAIGAATLWFGNMLARVPLDSQSEFGYLLMLPLLLIVPAFSLAALRLAWSAFGNRQTDSRTLIVVVTLTAVAFNLLAIGRFGSALWRIFAN